MYQQWLLFLPSTKSIIVFASSAILSWKIFPRLNPGDGKVLGSPPVARTAKSNDIVFPSDVVKDLDFASNSVTLTPRIVSIPCCV